MDSALLALGGEVDLTLRPELLWRLGEALEYDDVRLDCRAVTYVDAGSLRLIDGARRLLALRGDRFAVVRTSSTFDRVCALAGFEELRRIVPAPRVPHHVIRVPDQWTNSDSLEDR